MCGGATASATASLTVLADSPGAAARRGHARQRCAGQGRAEAATIERNCLCSLWLTNPEWMAAEGYPRGLCAFCDVCGQPGHTRHFPGRAPFTGSWCDVHCRRTARLHPLGRYGRWACTGAYGGDRLRSHALPRRSAPKCRCFGRETPSPCSGARRSPQCHQSREGRRSRASPDRHAMRRVERRQSPSGAT